MKLTTVGSAVLTALALSTLSALPAAAGAQTKTKADPRQGEMAAQRDGAPSPGGTAPDPAGMAQGVGGSKVPKPNPHAAADPAAMMPAARPQNPQPKTQAVPAPATQALPQGPAQAIKPPVNEKRSVPQKSP